MKNSTPLPHPLAACGRVWGGVTHTHAHTHSIFALLLAIIALMLAGCSDVTIDESGIKSVDPKRAAEAYATRTAAETAANERALKLETAKRAQDAESERLRIEAEAEAYKARVLAEAQADTERVRLVEQARAGVQVSQAFATSLSIVLVLGAAGAVIWISGVSYSRARNSVLASNYVRIGVDPNTMQPPPIIITHDGMLLDTRTGERAKVRDAVGVNQLLLAAVTHNLDMAMMASAAKDIAQNNAKPNSGGAQVADQLANIAEAVPVIMPPDEDRNITAFVSRGAQVEQEE